MAEEVNTITTIFQADISNFTKSTQDMKRYIAAANSEFKAATGSMDKWSDSQDGLNAKIKQLDQTLTAQNTLLQNSKDQYEELVRQGKQNSKQAQDLRNKINDQSAAVQETQKNIDHYKSSLKELADAGAKTKQDLEKLNKEQDELKSNAKELAGGLLTGAAAGIAGLATACVGAIKGLSALVENTKELRTQMGQLDTAFASNNLSADAAATTYGELFGVVGDSGKATEASMHLSQLANSEKELTDYTNILTGVYAQFGDSLPIESLAEGMQITASLGEVNGTMADALEFSGLSVDDFNAKLATLNTEEERSALISQTLNGLYGESAQKYKETNAEVIAANEAQNQYNQTMADIATEVQPVMTQFKLAMVDVLQTIMTKFQDVDIEGLIGKISTAISNLVDNVLPPLMAAITWILDNLDWLVPVLGTLIGLIGGIVVAFKTYNAVMKIARTAQLLFNAALSANPIGLVVIAIAGLVAAFVILWNKCEGFRNFFIKMWDGIKKTAKAAGDFIGQVFSGLFGFYKSFINSIIKGVNKAIGLLNKIKIPDWEIFGKYAGKGINIKTIPQLAQGGVVDKPTLSMVGEAGKEAVVPLENNTEWIDKLAAKLNAKQTAPSNVVVNNTFEKMETTRYAMHKAKLETMKALKLGV